MDHHQDRDGKYAKTMNQKIQDHVKIRLNLHRSLEIREGGNMVIDPNIVEDDSEDSWNRLKLQPTPDFDNNFNA
ncbi:hypothetical protein NPIL_201421 [Nephila pilipes]|uniref:Uncharacterized protein n=1 Tax=Nephila pilipes TaxID=299642 RepID=A0A8X6U3T0_NEPPI|nr:hypothetical protein NPIL_201421 [Nephila pilipes]